MLKRIKSLITQSSTTPDFQHLSPTLQPIEPAELLRSNRENIQSLKIAWSDEPTWKSQIEPCLIAYAKTVQRLPFAAQGLFADTDGLFRAGLDAARYSLMMMESYVQLHENILTQDRLQTRMRAAALLAGLTAFLYATVDHFTIEVETHESGFFNLSQPKAPAAFSPLGLTYYDWIHQVMTKDAKTHVIIRWKNDLTERSIGKDLLNVFIARSVIPASVMAWLTEIGNLPALGLLNTIAGFTNTSSLSAITKARDLGVYRASLLERERLGQAFGQSFEHQGWQPTLIRILRHRMKVDWPINSKDSPLRMGADGLFLFWPDVLDCLLDDLKTFGLTDLPRDASLWAGMMMHQGITKPSKNGTATLMIAVTPNAKPREAIKLDPHYFLDKSQWENAKVTKRDFEVVVSPTIETGLSRLTREVLKLDMDPQAIETEVKTKKPRVLWHMVEMTLHPEIQAHLEALMEKLTVDTRFAKASMVDEGLLLSSQSIPTIDQGFDLLVMQLLLADVIYATEKHEPLWIEHIDANGQSVRAVVMKPSVFAIEFIDEDVAEPLDYEVLFETVHGRAPQNRWEAADVYQLTLTEDNHA